MISSLAGENSTCPNVNHLLTVILPTLKLTWLIGLSTTLSLSLSRSSSGAANFAIAEGTLECLEPLESRCGFGERLLEFRGFRGVELLRSPYAEKKSENDMGVVGVWTVVRRSFILALISAL